MCNPRLKKGIPAVLLLVLLIPFAVPAAIPSFYLSTDRIFSSKDEVFVKVESRSLRKLDLRVYQVKNPRRFFLRQKKVYQAQGYGRRVPGIRQLTGALFRAVKRDAVEILKSKVNYRSLREKVRTGVREFIGQPRRKKPLVLSRVRGYLQGFKLVDQITASLNPGKGNWNYSLVRLPVYRKGVYLIEGIEGKDAGYCVAVISDLAVLSRHSSTKALFYSVNRLSGKPSPGKMLLYRPGSGGMTKRSDRSGLTVLRQRSLLLGQVYAMAESVSGFSLHDATFYPSSSFSVNPMKVYLYTDRPVYKPGQKLHFRGVLRRYRNQHYYNAAGAGRSLRIRIYDYREKEQAVIRSTVTSFGTVSGSWSVPKDVRPGMYRMVLEYGGKRYASVFRIKHYVKPPFLVTVRPEKKAFSFRDEIRGVIRARYFFGEPVKNARVRYYVYRVRRFQSRYFGEPYGWYLRDSEYRNTKQEMVHEGKGKTDSSGKLAFSFNANAENLKGRAYTYRIEARVMDRSGRLVTGSSSVRVLEGKFYLLLQAEKNYFRPGERGRFRIRALSYAGGSVEPDVRVRIYRYVWNTKFMARAAAKDKVFDKLLDLSKKNTFRALFRERGHYRIELSAKDSSGNTVTTGRFFWVAGNADQLVVRSSGLKIIPDKKIYRPGDVARILVVSPVPGASLFHTVEGDTIYSKGVLRMRGNTALIKLLITEEMMPNAYLHLAFVHNDKVYRARRQLFVPPAKRFIRLKAEGLKKRYEPGEEVSFRVRATDSSGKGVATELSLAVTDEAIFSIQGQLVLDIEKFFYHPHRNNVVTASSFYTRFYGYSDEDRLAMSRRLHPDTALASFSKGRSRVFNSGRRRRFKDRAFWSGSVRTAANGYALIRFRLPDNITSWRFHMVAVDGKERVGSGRFSCVSRRDFFVRAVFPEKVMEGETVRLGAVLHNLKSSPVRAKVSLKVEGGTASGGKEQDVTVPANGERKLFWKVVAGSGKQLAMRVDARGELRDAVERRVPVLPFARKLWMNWTGPVAKGNSHRFYLNGSREVAGAALNFRVSPGVVYLIQDSLKFLVGYPYGCVEQTLSKFVPNLYVRKMIRQLPFKDRFIIDKLPGLIRTGINRLATMQNTDGSWGWYRKGNRDLFMTAYAVYSLALASKLGYARDVRRMLRRGRLFLERKLRRDDGLDNRLRAFVLYSLQTYNNRYSSLIGWAMDQLKPDQKLTALFLANAAIGTRYQPRARAIIDRFLNRLRVTTHPEGLKTASLEAVADNSSWKRDSNFANALLLRAMVRLDAGKEKCRAVVNHLLLRRRDGGWKSTRDTALILTALADYSKKYQTGGTSGTVTLTVNGKKREIGNIGTGRSVRIGKDMLRSGRNRITVKGEGDMLYTASLNWMKRGGIFRPTGGTVRVKREYFRLVKRPDGKYITGRPAGERGLSRGEAVLVRLSVYSSKIVDYFMLDERLPTGFQVLEEKDDNLVSGVRLGNYLTREKYPDRLVFFKRYLRRGVTRISYLAVPTLAGIFKVLPAAGTSMYYPGLAGSCGGTVLKVDGN